MIHAKSTDVARLLLATLLLAMLVGCGEQRPGPRPAPGFSLPQLDDSSPLQLSDYRGSVVYVTFWASWCLPCRQEMPYLAQLVQRHYGEGFHVLAVNVDEDVALAQAFVDEVGISFPVLLDSNREVSRSYRVPGFPTHYLIDRDGDIRYSGIGFDLNDVRAVSQEVATLLGESATVE